MKCPHCGAEVEASAFYCNSCGGPLETLTAVEDTLSDEGQWVSKTIQMDRPEVRVPRWRLARVEGQDIPDGYPLRARILIGRDPQCEIQLPSPRVSRIHAVIEWNGSGFVISDQNSTNGTYINRALINQPTNLRIGQSLHIGEYSFLVMKDAAECRHCHARVRTSDAFCSNCGRRLVDDTVAPRAADMPRPLAETTPLPAQPDRADTPLFILSGPALPPSPAAPAARPPQPAAARPAAPLAVRPRTAKPAPARPSEPQGKAASGQTLWRNCLILAVASVCALTAIAAGFYYLYTSGALPF